MTADAVVSHVHTLLDAVDDGGTGIVPLDVAYAICASRENGIRKIFAAKNRSYEKPSGMLANTSMSRTIHQLDEWKHTLIENIVADVGLPFSVVAPFDSKHPFFANTEAFVMRSSTKVGTLDMLLNAGIFHDEIARQSWIRQRPVFGSSANASLHGSKFRYQDIDAPVRAAADIHFDYGESRYANADGRSSTIIDFENWRIIREGVACDELMAAFARHGVMLIRAHER
jgi:tRNA A37 threonylcarbamoyladenosine synthetase subunit TsaC/SUA5/YrdC